MAFLRHNMGLEGGAILRGRGVELRAPRASDYQAWAALRLESRSRLEVVEPLWAEDELSRAAYRRRLAHYARDAREGTGLALFIARAADGALIGGVTLSNMRRGVNQSASLGYWIGVSHWGQGHMTAALAALIPFAFQELKLHRLEAACLPTNAGSIRVLERSGFVREGYARSYLKIAGEWRDHLIFGLVDSDWRQKAREQAASSKEARE
jgi:ribosomal-protein-alanine N-acetyltransferase